MASSLSFKSRGRTWRDPPDRASIASAVSAARRTLMLRACSSASRTSGAASSIAKDAGGFKRGDLNLVVQVAQQECDARRRRRIANFLDRDQRLVHHRVVFGVQRLRPDPESRRARAARPIARAALARASMLAPTARQLAQRRDHVRPHLHVGVDDLIVGVAELRLNGVADALEGSAHPGLDVARQVHVDQAVGRADLDFGIAVARRDHQRIDRLGAADLDQRLHRFNAHAQVGIADIGRDSAESHPRPAWPDREQSSRALFASA